MLMNKRTKQARLQEGESKAGSRNWGASPTALLRDARMATTYIKLGHSYTSSHTRAVQSPLHDASCRPSGLQHTDHTAYRCPSSVLTHAPVSTSQSRTVLSALPDATIRPSGLKHTEFT